MIEVLTALAACINVFTDLSERLISMESRNEHVMAWVTGYEERIAEIGLLRREGQEVIGKMEGLGWHFWELVMPSATLLLLMEEKGQFVAGRPGLGGVDSEGGNLKKWQVVGRRWISRSWGLEVIGDGQVIYNSITQTVQEDTY
jgi:hypothetical protein